MSVMSKFLFSKRAAKDAELSPFPKELKTPPVTKIYLVGFPFFTVGLAYHFRSLAQNAFHFSNVCGDINGNKILLNGDYPNLEPILQRS